MARAGGGGGGGRSGGGRSSSRSSGGHRMSSGGSRAGVGRSSFGGSGPRAGGGPSPFGGGHPGPGFGGPPPRMPRRRSRPIIFGGPVHVGGFRVNTLGIFVFIFILALLLSTMSMGSAGNIPASTVDREKVDTGMAFQTDCVLDELGWFNSTSSTGRQLRDFYEETGVQPYIYLRSYDPSLTTDSEKLEFAHQWYEDNIDNEGTFLYVYFAEADQDGDVGYMCYVAGYQVTTVMDAEAVDIFWAYLDNGWYSDKSTDALFVDAFNNTADQIMDKTTTGADVALGAVIFLGIAAVLVLVIWIIKTKRKQEKEANEEAERILNTPLEDLDPLADLADKYTKLE